MNEKTQLKMIWPAALLGRPPKLVIPNGYASHFIWRDPTHILAQSRHWLGNSAWSNFLFEDKEGGKVEQVGLGVLNGSGHISYLPGNEWILNDTYPDRKKREQRPYLYHVPSRRKVELGRFRSPRSMAILWCSISGQRSKRNVVSFLISSTSPASEAMSLQKNSIADVLIDEALEGCAAQDRRRPAAGSTSVGHLWKGGIV